MTSASIMAARKRDRNTQKRKSWDFLWGVSFLHTIHFKKSSWWTAFVLLAPPLVSEPSLQWIVSSVKVKFFPPLCNFFLPGWWVSWALYFRLLHSPVERARREGHAALSWMLNKHHGSTGGVGGAKAFWIQIPTLPFTPWGNLDKPLSAPGDFFFPICKMKTILPTL